MLQRNLRYRESPSQSQATGHGVDSRRRDACVEAQRRQGGLGGEACDASVGACAADAEGDDRAPPGAPQEGCEGRGVDRGARHLCSTAAAAPQGVAARCDGAEAAHCCCRRCSRCCRGGAAHAGTVARLQEQGAEEPACAATVGRVRGAAARSQTCALCVARPSGSSCSGRGGGVQAAGSQASSSWRRRASLGATPVAQCARTRCSARSRAFSAATSRLVEPRPPAPRRRPRALCPPLASARWSTACCSRSEATATADATS